MIKIKIEKTKITITGHADFAKYGKDIVCASVSSIVCTSVNDMKAINASSVDYKDNGKQMEISLGDNNVLVTKLFTNLIKLLNSLANDYPKNIKIESEE